MKKENMLIIGSGPAGLTAAIYSARALLKPVVIAGIVPGGQLTQTSDIENYPGFVEPVGGFDLMTAFQKQSERFGTKVLYDNVVSVVFSGTGPHEVSLAGGEKIQALALIIATGASPIWLGLESEQRLMAKGVSACATCDGAFYRNLPVAVIGGGDTAMEEAIFLTRFASKVTVIHRRNQLRASKIMADRALQNPKIAFEWDSVVEEITGQNEVDGIVVRNLKSGEKKRIECKGYFAALGHKPNTEIFKGLLDMDDVGYILLKNQSSHTSVEGVFAAGDCADHVYRQAITAAGMGCKAAIDAERWLESKHKT
ncbi:MAG TPA: thioredoxin-disulfide reductase [Lentisphaeria bacterium]|nr:MAG: thioredoxin-disulfide reductase [Lentisphaerae bacterium GWF2_49_21]HBC85633.1 thioredoxin-disulfide reductase [Lentisphaeria bacterium]